MVCGMSVTLNERLQVLLTTPERKDLERIAKRENRSLSFVARRAILAELKRAKP